MATARLSASLGAAGVVVLAAAPAAHADEQDHEQAALSSDVYGGVLLAEGVGAFPTDEPLDLMIAAEAFDVPDDVEIWAYSPEDEDPVLIGSGETESDTYVNPGAETPTESEVELIEVTLPQADVPATGWYAFLALDESTGELITWSSYPVLGVDGGDVTGGPGDHWPVPDISENLEPSTEPPTLDDLTEQGYGLISIDQEEPVLPLDETLTLQIDGVEGRADLWLLPPDGEDAAFLVTEPASDGLGVRPGDIPWRTVVPSENAEYNGIYGLVATHEEAGVVAWTPFAVSADGGSLEVSDPGVDDSDPAYSDRSIWPIPDSIPGAEGEQDDDAEEGDESETGNSSATEEGTDDNSDEESSDTDTTGAEQTSDSAGLNTWALIAAVGGGALLIAAAAVILWRRGRA